MISAPPRHIRPSVTQQDQKSRKRQIRFCQFESMRERCSHTGGEVLKRRGCVQHFIGIPVVNPKKQNRPTRTAKEIERIIAVSRNRYRVLYSLLAGGGLRIGEALALRIGEHISGNSSTIRVRQSLWRAKEQEPKTRAAVRDVDVTKELAALLAFQVHRRPQGWLLVLHGDRQPTIATKHSSGQPAPYFGQAQSAEDGLPLFQAFSRIRPAGV